MPAQEETITQAGGALDAEDVTLSSNTVADREDNVIEFRCPRKFDHIEYAAESDPVRFVPRTVQEVSGTANDDTVVALNNDIQPVHGEEAIEDQDYPVARAYNVTQDTEVDIVDADYAANTVTLGTDPADGDTVKVWPILAEGTLRIEGFNQFDQSEGVLFQWGFPLRRFHDFQQNKRGTEINLHGRARWFENESLAFRVESPHPVVWEDADYPDAYVSTFQVDVSIGY